MMLPTVYLAGPISGLGYDAATDWRNIAERDLELSGIKALSPLRAKEYLRDIAGKLEHPYPVGTRVVISELSADDHGTVKHSSVVGYSIVRDSGIRGWFDWDEVKALTDDIGLSAICDYGHLSPLSGARGVMTRDRFDATRCDVLLVNLMGAKKVSIGTCMEIAWADLKRTPIVVAMEADGSNPHEHAMVTEAIGFRCGSLAEALHVTRSILS